MNKNIILGCFIFIITLSPANAQSSNSDPQYLEHYNRGKQHLSKLNYAEAIDEFYKSAESGPSHFKPAVYSMIGQSYLAMGNHAEAEKVFDYLSSTYPDSQEYLESLYSKGRISFLNGNYETAIDRFNTFIDSADYHPLKGSAFFWIAESLYNLGHIDESLSIYRIVSENFRESYKYEAAKYRIELINLGRREQELVKLLKWSHEEALREREEFIKKEKEYNQAILSYQRKLADISDEDAGTALTSLRETNLVLRKQIELQEEVIKKLNNEIDILKGNIREAETTNVNPSPGSAAVK